MPRFSVFPRARVFVPASALGLCMLMGITVSAQQVTLDLSPKIKTSRVDQYVNSRCDFTVLQDTKKSDLGFGLEAGEEMAGNVLAAKMSFNGVNDGFIKFSSALFDETVAVNIDEQLLDLCRRQLPDEAKALKTTQQLSVPANRDRGLRFEANFEYDERGRHFFSKVKLWKVAKGTFLILHGSGGNAEFPKVLTRLNEISDSLNSGTPSGGPTYN